MALHRLAVCGRRMRAIGCAWQRPPEVRVDMLCRTGHSTAWLHKARGWPLLCAAASAIATATATATARAAEGASAKASSSNTPSSDTRDLGCMQQDALSTFSSALDAVRPAPAVHRAVCLQSSKAGGIDERRQWCLELHVDDSKQPHMLELSQFDKVHISLP